jgi:hypothetical protein
MFRIRFRVLILAAVLAMTVLATSGALVNADPADYKIEAQELDGTWTPGMVTGYLECNNVPMRLNATYKKNERGTYQVNLGALYLDTSTPNNKGVDYFVDFTYVDPDGALSGTPTVTEQENVHNLPWAGGSGTGDTAVQPNGVTQLLYKLTFTVNDWSDNVQKTVTFYWKAHLALSPHGAFFWTGPPVSNLQVFADPPSGGTKTVNIRRPEMVSVTKKVEAQHFMGYDWTLEKSATPASLSLTPGEAGTVTYTITVQRDPLDVYRMRGNITIRNLYADLSVCVDVLDQVQSTNTDDPDGYIDNARWTWDDQSIPAAGQLVLYFPGPTSSEWFEFPPDSVTEGTTYYNTVWVGLMADLGCPTVSAATADWTTDYDRVVSNYTSFTFTRVEDGVTTIVVDDHETLSGPIELVSVSYDPAPYPWTVSDDATLKLSKTVRCTGFGIGIITDHAEARDPESEELITESNEVTVYVYQLGGGTAGLTVIKHVIGGTKVAADFTLHVKTNGQDVSGSPFPGNEQGTPFILNAGTYTVSEDPIPDYSSSISGDCDAVTGSVTLNEGDSKTCTITNEFTGGLPTEPVGGELYSVDKSALVQPYVGLLGLLGALATAVATTRSRRP